jgi:NTP pyrophosphatase (non-canonical NTP hydrolase)
MKINEYQELSKRTMPNKGFEMDVSNYSMGLSGEAGEVVDVLKKIIHHGHEHNNLSQLKLMGELGDVMHYVSGLCTLLNLNLEDVCKYNIEKLKTRYPEGFSTEASVNRND